MATLNKQDVELLQKAFNQAALWHADHLRKATNIPYLTHLMDVSSLVLKYEGNSIQAAAGLLHDALEDAPDDLEALARKDWVKAELGPQVLEIVLACSDGIPNADGIKPPWEERKLAYLKHLASASEATWLVSCCDKLNNAEAIVSDLENIGESLWERFSSSKEQSLWYYDQLATFFLSKNVAPAKELSRQVELMKQLAKANS